MLCSQRMWCLIKCASKETKYSLMMNILSHFAAVMSLKNEENLSRMLKTLCDVIQFCLMEAAQPIRLGFLEREIVHCNYASINVKNLGNFYIRSQCASLLALTMLGVCWIMLCFFSLCPYPMESEGQKFWMPFGQVISNYHRSISDIIIHSQWI